MLDRKADARKKIALGGLLIKAGFGAMGEDQAHIIYGMLLDCKRALANKPDLEHRWAQLGCALFTKQQGPAGEV